MRIDNLLARRDAGLGKRERERLVADAFVAQPVGLRSPETDYVRAWFAPDPIELVHPSIPASAKHRRQSRKRLRRHRRDLHRSRRGGWDGLERRGGMPPPLLRG